MKTEKTIRINASAYFGKNDVAVIYFKNGEWKLYTYTDGYRLLKRDKERLIEDICIQYFITDPNHIKFAKMKEWVVYGE